MNKIFMSFLMICLFAVANVSRPSTNTDYQNEGFRWSLLSEQKDDRERIPPDVRKHDVDVFNPEEEMDGVHRITSFNSSGKPIGYGSGFVVLYKGNYFLVTALHVVRGSSTIKLIHKNKPVEFKINRVHYRYGMDAAVFHIGKMKHTLPLAKGVIREKVTAHGYAGARQYKKAKGHKGPRFYIVTDCEMIPGMSGGPLLNERGEVIGINIALLNTPNGALGFHVPIDRVLSLLDDVCDSIQEEKEKAERAKKLLEEEKKKLEAERRKREAERKKAEGTKNARDRKFPSESN